MNFQPVLPKGSLILVTGINGFAASHVANELLQRGYRVRGTARNEQKGSYMSDMYQKLYGTDAFEPVVVPDLNIAGALDEAVKGCSGVVHTTADLSFSPDPHKVITPTVDGMNNILKTIASNPSVKRLVITSSAIVAVRYPLTQSSYIDESSWNEDLVTEAWKPPPYEAHRAASVYGAAKLESDRAALNFVRDNKVGFTVVTILSTYIMGRILHPQQRGSSGAMIKAAWENNAELTERLKMFIPNLHMNVEDLALLHIGALLDPQVVNERILAYCEPFDFNKIIDVMHKIDPQRELPPKLDAPSFNLDIKPRPRSLEVITRLGKDGFKSFEQTVAENVGPFLDF